MSDTPDPTEVCEEILRAEKQYNLDHAILPSENAVIDRLLGRRIELTDAYAELHSKLAARPNALKTLLGVVLSTAAFWNPDRIAEARGERQRLKAVNALIADKAADLAALLRERSELHNASGFAGNTHYHVCRVIEDAAKANYLFGSWVRDDLRALRGRFDLKYWPRIHEFVDALAHDARNAVPEPTDPVTAAATAGIRGSRADFFKALQAAIEENSSGSGGFLPPSLRLTDPTLASLANCALDLGPDDLADGDYVKRLRQRARDSARRARVARADPDAAPLR
jgi:hypothetical protein